MVSLNLYIFVIMFLYFWIFFYVVKYLAYTFVNIPYN